MILVKIYLILIILKIKKSNKIINNFKKFLAQNNLKAKEFGITGFKKINKNLIK